jgi:hypothetical protein
MMICSIRSSLKQQKKKKLAGVLVLLLLLLLLSSSSSSSSPSSPSSSLVKRLISTIETTTILQTEQQKQQQTRKVESNEIEDFRATEKTIKGVGAFGGRVKKACGNAPRAFLPDDLAFLLGPTTRNTYDDDDDKRKNCKEEGEDHHDIDIIEETDEEEEVRLRIVRRHLLISKARAFANRNGLTMPIGCDDKLGFVKHENFGEGAKPKIDTFINEGEKMLKKCVETTKRGEDCVDTKVIEAAKNIAKQVGFMRINKKFQYETCALVGNGGSVLRKQFGEYINNHDLVVRFNMAPISGFEQHVGNRTDVWVNGHEASKRLCCIGSAKMGIHAKDHVMWFPAKQNVIKSACEKRKIKTKALGDGEIPEYVAKMNKIRYESRRLGLGRNYDNWLQLTTGAHGIFYFLSKCKRVSIYGFSVWKERNAMGENLDQYGGRKSKVHSGNIFHDWSMETNAWKILHTANVLDVCT